MFSNFQFIARNCSLTGRQYKAVFCADKYATSILHATKRERRGANLAYVQSMPRIYASRRRYTKRNTASLSLTLCELVLAVVAAPNCARMYIHKTDSNGPPKIWAALLKTFNQINKTMEHHYSLRLYRTNIYISYRSTIYIFKQQLWRGYLCESRRRGRPFRIDKVRYYVWPLRRSICAVAFDICAVRRIPFHRRFSPPCVCVYKCAPEFWGKFSNCLGSAHKKHLVHKRTKMDYFGRTIS